MLCLACGCDISVKSADRRRLDNPKATSVVALWKHLALQDETCSDSELNRLLMGSGKPDDQGKMCRKCFAAYERLIEVTDTLKNNQSKFFNTIMEPKDDAPPLTKRPCASATISIPTSKWLGLAQSSASTSTHKSPPVIVSYLL